MIRTVCIGVVLGAAVACTTQPKSSSALAKAATASEGIARWDARAKRAIEVTGLKVGELIKSDGVDCQIRLSDEGLEGSTILWALNNLPPIALSGRDGRLTIKEGLKPGANVLRIFVLGPGQQMALNSEAQVQIGFSYQAQGQTGPSVYVVSPRGAFSKQDGEVLPFQLLIHNEGARASKVFVRYSLNSEEREMTGSGPFEFKNLPPGNYKVEAWLVNSAGRKIDGSFASSQTTFTIQR